MSGDDTVAVAETPAPAAPAAPAPVLGEPMDIMTALQLVLKKAQAHGGLIKGLRECAKVIEKHHAQLCLLAEDCDQADYVKLVKALCADHNVNLITVPSAKTIGEWAGLCKIDPEGKARKVNGCSCLVVKDFGEETEGLHIVQEDGVSESQFNQVMNIELDQIIEACKFLDEKWCPKFLVIIAQKNHHTKFFQTGGPDNVPPGNQSSGTIIDCKVGHPRNNDFYMCAHAGMIGTTRPTHYHVLHDEIGFSPDDLQELVHSLSYVYQRSTTAISLVAPVCYAHLAASQVGQFMKFEEMSETSSSHNGVSSAGAVPVPQLPKLNEKVSSSMFFC